MMFVQSRYCFQRVGMRFNYLTPIMSWTTPPASYFRIQSSM